MFGLIGLIGLKWYLSEASMPCSVKGNPLEEVCLGFTLSDICRGHCDILNFLSIISPMAIHGLIKIVLVVILLFKTPTQFGEESV